jgi:hypothetical protein
VRTASSSEYVHHLIHNDVHKMLAFVAILYENVDIATAHAVSISLVPLYGTK